MIEHELEPELEPEVNWTPLKTELSGTSVKNLLIKKTPTKESLDKETLSRESPDSGDLKDTSDLDIESKDESNLASPKNDIIDTSYIEEEKSEIDIDNIKEEKPSESGIISTTSSVDTTNLSTPVPGTRDVKTQYQMY